MVKAGFKRDRSDQAEKGDKQEKQDKQDRKNSTLKLPAKSA